MASNERVILTCAASLLTLLVAYVSYAALKAKKYVRRTKIAKLVIYPIKSVPGVEVAHLDILRSFCKYKNFLDRSWMLVDDMNRMITLRNEPLLAKIRMRLLDDELCLEADGMPSVRIPTQPQLKKGDRIHTVDVFGQEIDGQDCGEEVNGWFQKFLGKPNCKLVKHHDLFEYRGSYVVENEALVPRRGKNMDILYQVCAEKELKRITIFKNTLLLIVRLNGLQDAAPVHVVNNKSVEELNERIRKEHGDEQPPEVKWERFRPNIFFETDTAFEEDTWKYLKINRTEFEFLGKPPL